MTPSTSSHLPTFFVSHGGGPWPWMTDMLPGDWAPLERSLRSIPEEVGTTPEAVLLVSGHWEAPEFTLQANPHPPMLYDYGGFPEFTYHVQYPAPGSPELAGRAAALLERAGLAARFDETRGFDHGAFVPLHVAYPDADVPVVQLSLRHGYDPQEHLAAGRALAPLRDEGVLILASGFTYHNLARMGPEAERPSREFDDWLTETLIECDPPRRTQRLLEWEQAPSSRLAHPSEDHLVPLMVAVGAAEGEPATRFYNESAFMGSISSSSYRFGSTVREPVGSPGD